LHPLEVEDFERKGVEKPVFPSQLFSAKCRGAEKEVTNYEFAASSLHPELGSPAFAPAATGQYFENDHIS
jgi:hypothetical protein